MNQDFRVALSPANEVKNFKTGQVYEIISELGRGGSSIVYEVFRKDNPAKHYALKEYYPINEALTIRRDGCKLFFENGTDSQSVAGKYSEREQRILNYLPNNNSEDGRYFIYKEESFEANGTHYVVTDLDNCQALAESTTKDDLQSLLYALTDVCRGLAALHHNGVYHLDISSRNILIPKSGCAKITDFGAAATKEELENNSLTYEDFVFTPAFSSMEVKRAAHKGMIRNINPSCDTYSVCAILFRYTVGRSFEPTEDLTSCAWEKDLHVKYHDKYTRSYINRLIGILRKGLSGQNFRYDSADKLAEDMEKLSQKCQKDKKTNAVCKIAGITLCGVSCFMVILYLVLFVSTPKPQLILQSSLEPVYYNGDSIIFDVKVFDRSGSDGTHISDVVHQITLHGFSASRKATRINTYVYRIELTDISFNEDGEKSFSIGYIYASERWGKKNEPLTYSFSGYVDEPRIVISQPTFTRVNSGHTVTYTVEFQVPEGQEAEIDASTLTLRNFSCGRTTSTQTGPTTYEITFSEIGGSPGTCTFAFPEGACKLKNGACSKETTSPNFDIVENNVSNTAIHPYLHVVSQELQDGGYILLEHGTYSGQDYISLLDDKMITLTGFTADIHLQHSYILLDNLSLEKGQAYTVSLEAGAYISKDNGSISAQVECLPLQYIDSVDTSPPAVTIGQLGENPRHVKQGGNLILLVACADNSSCILNRIENMFDTIGFAYDDCQISVTGLMIRIVYTNVKSLGDSDEKCCVILRDGTFKDLSGNESRQVKFPFTINP